MGGSGLKAGFIRYSLAATSHDEVSANMSNFSEQDSVWHDNIRSHK